MFLLVVPRFARIFFMGKAKAFWNHQPGWWFSLTNKCRGQAESLLPPNIQSAGILSGYVLNQKRALKQGSGFCQVSDRPVHSGGVYHQLLPCQLSFFKRLDHIRVVLFATGHWDARRFLGTPLQKWLYCIRFFQSHSFTGHFQLLKRST